MPQEMLSLAMVDDALKPLLDGLTRALQSCGPVVAHTLWRPLPYTTLLPFHLHLCWAGYIDILPLTITCSVVPFLHDDARLAQIPLYEIEEVHKIRDRARFRRYTLKTYLPDDFKHPDWEESLKKPGHREALRGKLLAGNSFLAVDTVSRSGQIVRGPRPYLGAKAVRDAPRPHIFVPAHGQLSQEAYTLLASTDLLLVNLQGIKGKNALTTAHEVLRRRKNTLPSLIIASSPGELSAVGWPELNMRATHHFISVPPTVSKVKISLVGKDRPQRERDFHFAVTDVKGWSPQTDMLVQLATAAWWAGRQQMLRSEIEDITLRRFSAALEQVSMDTPSDARLLTSAATLITKTFAGGDFVQERLDAVMEALFSIPSQKRTLVIAKHNGVATQLQKVIAESIDVPLEEVAAAGIVCCGTSTPTLNSSYDYAVVCGYFGPSTIDTLLSSGAANVYFVVDPVEAGVAWNHLRKMSMMMDEYGSHDTACVLQRLCSAFYSYILPFTDVISLSLEDRQFLSPSFLSHPFQEIRQRNGSRQENVIILFVDGTWLEVSRTARLEIIDRQGSVRLRTVLPTELQAGDEMIVVASDTRMLFSENLMQRLDAGRLRSLVEKHDDWLTLVKTMIQSTRPNLRAIHRRLIERGIEISYQTVLSWARPGAQGDQTIPMRWWHFKALAEELHLPLPETDLADLFHAIRLLRVHHRLAGRNLVRAMRNAYLGRLDTITLAKIEQEWGFGARELMQSTRLLEVDSVLF